MSYDPLTHSRHDAGDSKVGHEITSANGSNLWHHHFSQWLTSRLMQTHTSSVSSCVGHCDDLVSTQQHDVRYSTLNKINRSVKRCCPACSRTADVRPSWHAAVASDEVIGAVTDNSSVAINVDSATAGRPSKASLDYHYSDQVKPSSTSSCGQLSPQPCHDVS